jgi:hypothetical protein
MCRVATVVSFKLARQVHVTFHFLKIISMYHRDIIFNTEISSYGRQKTRLSWFQPNEAF